MGPTLNRVVEDYEAGSANGVVSQQYRGEERNRVLRPPVEFVRFLFLTLAPRYVAGGATVTTERPKWLTRGKG